MPTKYTKSITSDFSGNSPFLRKLHDAIEANGTITTAFVGVQKTGDSVELIFDSALSGAEQTELDSLIAGHDNTPIKTMSNYFVMTPQNTTITTDYYSKCATLPFAGSDIVGTIDQIEVTAYMHSGVTSFDIRLYDVVNGLLMAEVTGLTNTEDTEIDIGTISNVPASKSRLEVQVKKTGGTKNNYIHVEAVTLYYNN